MYLTYAEYQSMGGTLDEATFADFEFEAECLVNWFTFNRLKTETTYPEELPRCMYALIKLAKLKADAMTLGSQTTSVTEGGVTTTVTSNATIASQSNDGVSISYNSVSASEVFNKLNAMQKGSEFETTVQLYLNGVKDSLGRKLLYRGLYPNE